MGSSDREGASDVEPPYLYPDYRSTLSRSPSRPTVAIPYGPTELTGPVGSTFVAGSGRAPRSADLTTQHEGEPLGERIIVSGRVLDAAGDPLPGVLVEIWQANAAGRYAHEVDQHPAPLDPSFSGSGHCLTGADGRYRFVTVKPGAYPWKNHLNAWRPAHIHFSVLGRAFSQRLVTQMYFHGDPLLPHDPIFASIPSRGAQERLLARLDLDRSVPEWALAYEFDIGLGGAAATPFDGGGHGS